MPVRAKQIGAFLLLFRLFASTDGHSESAPAPTATEAYAELPLTLQWNGTKACRPEVDLREHLRRLVGQQFAAARDGLLKIDVTTTTLGGTVKVHLNATLTQAGREHQVSRDLSLANCAELAQGLAIVIATWLLEQSSVAPEKPTLTETENTNTPELSAPIPAPTPAPDWVLHPQLRLTRLHFASQQRPDPRLCLGFGPVLAQGVFPEAAWGFTGAIGYAIGPLRLSAEGLLMTPQSSYRSETPRLGGRYTLNAGGIRLGYVWGRAHQVRLVPSVFALLGQIRAHGVGVDETATSTGAWGGSGVSNSFELQSGKVRLDLQFSVGLPFGRPRFLVDNTLVFQPPAWFGLAQLTVGVGIW